MKFIKNLAERSYISVTPQTSISYKVSCLYFGSGKPFNLYCACYLHYQIVQGTFGTAFSYVHYW